MFTKKMFTIVLVICAGLLTVGIGPAVAHPADALPPAQAGGTISYSGNLSDENGGPVTDGAYDFIFNLYDAPSAGNLLWSEKQTGVSVSAGKFSTKLGATTPLTAALNENRRMWLEVSVRGPGEANFTPLAPRQDFNSLSGGAALTCPHSHYGDSWTGNTSFDALNISNTNPLDADTLHVESYNTDANHGAIYARNYASTGAGDAINTFSSLGVGLRAGSGGTDGIDATTNAPVANRKSAVFAHTGSGFGVYATSSAAGAVYPNEYAAIDGFATGEFNVGGYFTSTVNAGAIIKTNVPGSYVGLLVDGSLNIINGICNGCSISYITLNAGSADIRKGDLVAVIGVQVDAATQQPIMLVQPATSAEDVIIGVAIGPGAPPSDPTRIGPQTAGKSGAGAAAPGEYVQVMVSGLAQVRVGAGKVGIGEYITAGIEGAIANATPSASMARVLSAVDADGFVWALIGAH
jgi:hypothetical protein